MRKIGFEQTVLRTQEEAAGPVHPESAGSAYEEDLDPLEIAAQALAHMPCNRQTDLQDIPENLQRGPRFVRKAQPEKRIIELDSSLAQHVLAKAKSGDRQALEELCVIASPDIARLSEIYSSKGNWLPAQDYFQAALIQVPKVAERYKLGGEASFKTLLYPRVLGAFVDEDRARMVESGVTRGQYKRLQEALETDNPEAALYKLIEEKKLPENFRSFISDGTLTMRPQSLDVQRPSPDGGFYSQYEPPAPEDTFESVASKLDSEALERLLSHLDEREQYVLKNVEGLFGTTPHTMPEVAVVLGVTDSRVSQIRSQAIEKLSLRASGKQLRHGNRNRSRLPSSPREREEFYDYLDRLYTGLDKHQDTEFFPYEIKAVLQHFSDWHYREQSIKNRDIKLMVRKNVNSAIIETLSVRSSRRRVVGYKDGALVVLVDKVTGDDLKAVIDIERALRQPSVLDSVAA